MITEPMLAGTWKESTKLRFPVLATPKLDGIRCLTLPPSDSLHRCRAVSRKFLPIPNVYVRSFIEANLPPGLDGELMVNGGKSFNEVSSGIMSRDGNPDFTYHVFDVLGADCNGLSTPYLARMAFLEQLGGLDAFKVKRILPVACESAEAMFREEATACNLGYEGLMIRTPGSPYKCGRSTEKEQWLLKIKRFVDDEATVIAVVELEHNTNEKKADAFGRAKRSTAKSGQVKGETMGTLTCRTKAGIVFDIGTGFTDADRASIWASRESMSGRIAKFKYQPHGVKEKPRSPVFLGFRSPLD